VPPILFYSQSGALDPADINPSNVLSVVLKTEGNGGWLTAVARWHMQYLLRRISRRRHDRVSELCANLFALRVGQCLAAVVHHASCIVWCHRAPSSHRALAPLQLVHRHTPPSCHPPPLRPPVTAATSWLGHSYAPGCRQSSLMWGVKL